MTTKPGTDLILDALAAEGLGHLFMVPGGLVDPFLAALARHEKIKPVVAALTTSFLIRTASPMCTFTTSTPRRLR